MGNHRIIDFNFEDTFVKFLVFLNYLLTYIEVHTVKRFVKLTIQFPLKVFFLKTVFFICNLMHNSPEMHHRKYVHHI